MRKFYSSLIAFLFSCTAFAQTNVFPPSGNVGIGLTAPQAKLHILQTAEDYDSGIKIVGSTSPISGRVWMAGESLHIDNATAGSGSGFTLTKDGNIGIGTSSPLLYDNFRVLDITGRNAGSGGYIRLATSNALGEARIFATNDRLALDVQKPGMYFQWRNASGDQLHRLNQNGSAVWKGNASSYTEIHSNENGSFLRQYENDGTSLSWIIRGYAHYADSVQAEFNKGGINVNGRVKSKEVNVTLDGWSDYVFEENYDLLPLKELQTYIQTNKHLPGIPAEEEVKRDGVNLGEMDAKLLAKIEELTLYLLQQSQKLAEQQKQLHEQQQEIDALKQRVEMAELKN